MIVHFLCQIPVFRKALSILFGKHFLELEIKEFDIIPHYLSKIIPAKKPV